MIMGLWGAHTCQPHTGHRLNLWESILVRSGEFQGEMPKLPYTSEDQVVEAAAMERGGAQ